MEEDVCLLAANRNVRGRAFGNGIRRSGNILLLLVLGELLVMAGFMLLDISSALHFEIIPMRRVCAHSWSTEIGVGYSQL